jgi:hypothetical protein
MSKKRKGATRPIPGNAPDPLPALDPELGVPADAEIVMPSTPFKFEVSGNLTVTIEGSDLVLRVKIEESVEAGTHYSSRPVVGRMLIPVESEKNIEAMQKWAAESILNFKRLAPEYFALEVWRVAAIAGQQGLIARGATPNSIERFIDKSIEASGAQLKELFPTGKRTRSPWTKRSLEVRVKKAMNAILARDGELNQDEVAEEMRRQNPEAAPQSGHSLGVLLPRHGLSWTTLKSHSKKGENVRYLDQP